jgi:hypothetical protein
MGMTNAERQRKYRQRAMHDPDGHLLTRLQVMVGASPANDLDRLQKDTGLDKRQLVECAISAYYKLRLYGKDADVQRLVALIAPELVTE